MPPTELIPVANVLLLPSGVNLRIEPLKVVAASSETKRFPLLSKHKPIGLLSPATKVLFVPSGVYLKTERLAKSATKRLRSEERRVGKECRARWEAYQDKKKVGKQDA